MGFFERLFGEGGPGTTTREVAGDTGIEVRTPPQVPIPLRRRSFESPIPISPQEEVLDSRDTSSERPIGAGVTKSRFLEIVDDGKAVFKTVDFPEERAAYLVDLFLGFGLVPTTVIRELRGEVGSVQEFISGTKSGFEFSKEVVAREYPDQLMKLWVFDLIIANKDRHSGNFLIKDGKMYAIDHGRTFGWSDNSSAASGRTSTFGENVNTRGSYLNSSFYPQNFDRPIPQDVVLKLKEFMTKTSEQSILENLLAELIGQKHAEMAIKRILAIGAFVVEHGIIPPEMYEAIKIPQ